MMTLSGIKVSHTPVRSLIRSVLSLQHEIHVLQATKAAEAWLNEATSRSAF